MIAIVTFLMGFAVAYAMGVFCVQRERRERMRVLRMIDRSIERDIPPAMLRRLIETEYQWEIYSNIPLQGVRYTYMKKPDRDTPPG